MATKDGMEELVRGLAVLIAHTRWPRRDAEHILREASTGGINPECCELCKAVSEVASGAQQIGPEPHLCISEVEGFEGVESGEPLSKAKEFDARRAPSPRRSKADE